MPAVSSRSKVPSIVRDRSGRSCESPPRRAESAGRPAQVPRVFTGVRRHRLDLALDPLSRADSRPRTLLRLLQVDISTSTTTDHPNISIHGEPRSGRLPGLERKLPFVRDSRRRCTRSGAEQDRCSTFPIAIARAGTSPRPRFAPGTWCRETPSLTGLERRGEEAALPTPDALARCARRRAAWRRTSAKRPSVDQPEVPSVKRAFANERAKCLPAEAARQGSRRLFHHRGGCAGRRPRTLTMARRVDR